MKKLIILLSVLLCCSTVVMADEPNEQLSNQTSTDKTLTMNVTDTVSQSYIWTIPAYLEFSDGVADLTIEIKEAHIRSDCNLNIKLLSHENYLKESNMQEQAGSSLRILNKDNKEISDGDIVLTASSYAGDNAKAVEEVKTTLSVILDKPPFLQTGTYTGNITFAASVDLIIS